MDRKTELAGKLEKFRLKCEENKKPLMDMWLEEAFPGDNSTSFVVKVRAKWLDKLSLSEGLDILLDILWKTTDIPTRIQIFAISVINTNDKNYKNLPPTNFVNQVQTDTSVFV
jgi:hypothetical protein